MTDVPNHDQLPLPDYDHLPVGDVESRIRSLDADGLQAVLAYERAHADRPAVVQVIENRLQAVREGAPLSGGSPLAPTPGRDAGPAGGSQVAPDTQGPPVNPPSHGDPTNPAQPRT